VAATSFTGEGSTLTDLDPANLSAGTAGIDISGTAANVTGTVALANGGTGATDAAGARTNLGVVAGAHTVDTDTTCLDAGVACNFAASASEGGAAITGDSATGFFSAGQIEEPRIADEIARDTEMLKVTRCLAKSGQRYLDLGDGTVLDCNTGLIWLEDASCDALGPNGNGLAFWQEALDAAAALAAGTCGLTDGSVAGDWRQPTIQELCSAWSGSSLIPCPSSAASDSLIDSSVTGSPKVVNAKGDAKWSAGDAFVGVQSSSYWSATALDATNAWLVSLTSGNVASTGKDNNFYVWPVRSGQ